MRDSENIVEGLEDRQYLRKANPIMSLAHPLNIGVGDLLIWQNTFRCHHEPAILVKYSCSEDNMLGTIGRLRPLPLSEQCKSK
jgi:hypothetical protein